MHRRWQDRSTADATDGVTLTLLDNHRKDDNMDAAHDSKTTRQHRSAPHRRDAGFTLMEMTMVVVILGLLAVTAMPRVVDLHSNANRAAAEGVAANVTTAFAMNYAVSLSGDDAVAFSSSSTPEASDIEPIIDIDASNYALVCPALAAPGIPTTCEVKQGTTSFAPPVNFFAIATQ